MKRRHSLSFRQNFGMFLCAFACVVNGAWASEGMDWNQYHGPKRDRISSETNWLSQWGENQPKQLWTTEVGKGFASISVVGDRVYTMGNHEGTDTVWCLDAKNGETVWTHTYASELFPNMHEGGPCGTPAVDAHAVFTVSKEGQMYCLNVADGKVKWSKDLKNQFGVDMPRWRFSSSPLLEDDLVIVDIGITVAFNKETGDVVWKTENYGSAYSSPIAFTLKNKQYYALFPQFGLVLIDASSGKEVSKYKWDTKYGVNTTTPIISGNQFFVSSGYGKGGSVVQMNESGTLEEIWYNRLMRNHMNSSVLWNGYLYGFDESNLKCIDFATGTEQWKHRGLGKGSLMLADGKLIILSERGELLVANVSEKGFEPTGKKQVLSGRCWTIPVLSHGKIFCRNADGTLVCLDVSQTG